MWDYLVGVMCFECYVLDKIKVVVMLLLGSVGKLKGMF